MEWLMLLLQLVLLIATLWFSVKFLLYVHDNFRAFFSDNSKSRFGRAVKPLGTLVIESMLFSGSAALLLAAGSWLLSDAWYDVLCYIPYGMFAASVLVWVTLLFRPLTRRWSKKREAAKQARSDK